MADWFQWNGVKCTEYGIHVSVQPEIIIPSERIETVSIPGRAGSLFTKEGDNIYDDIQYSFTCFIEDTSNIDEISKYLKGSGKLVIPRRENGYYDARISNQIPLSLLLRGCEYRSFSVTFECQPFFKPGTASNEIVYTTPGNVNNQYSIQAHPLIKIDGKSSSDSSTLMIGSYSLIFSKFPGTVYVDCDNGIAYTISDSGAYASYTSYITTCYTDSSGSYSTDDDWPILEPGDNMINWSGAITKVTITPNWRSL